MTSYVWHCCVVIARKKQVLITFIASQYATSIVNRCWSGFPCKWRYINVKTFNLLTFNLQHYHVTQRLVGHNSVGSETKSTE